MGAACLVRFRRWPARAMLAANGRDVAAAGSFDIKLSYHLALCLVSALCDVGPSVSAGESSNHGIPEFPHRSDLRVGGHRLCRSRGETRTCCLLPIDCIQTRTHDEKVSSAGQHARSGTGPRGTGIGIRTNAGSRTLQNILQTDEEFRTVTTVCLHSCAEWWAVQQGSCRAAASFCCLAAPHAWRRLKPWHTCIKAEPCGQSITAAATSNSQYNLAVCLRRSLTAGFRGKLWPATTRCVPAMALLSSPGVAPLPKLPT